MTLFTAQKFKILLLLTLAIGTFQWAWAQKIKVKHLKFDEKHKEFKVPENFTWRLMELKTEKPLKFLLDGREVLLNPENLEKSDTYFVFIRESIQLIGKYDKEVVIVIREADKKNAKVLRSKEIMGKEIKPDYSLIQEVEQPAWEEGK